MLKVRMVINGKEEVGWFETMEQLDRCVRNAKLQNMDYLKNHTGSVEYEILVDSEVEVVKEVRTSKFEAVNINTGALVKGDNTRDIVSHIEGASGEDAVSSALPSLIQTAMLTGDNHTYPIGDGWIFTRLSM